MDKAAVDAAVSALESTIHTIDFWALVCGIAVAVFLAGEIWFIGAHWLKERTLRPLRERQAQLIELEINRLTTEADIARAAIAQSNAKAAEASRKAAEAQLALEQYKTPRWISDAQREAFIAHLTQFHGVSADVWLIHAPTADAAPFASRLGGVLRDAGWNVTGVFNLMGGISLNGVMVATRNDPSAADEEAAKALVNELHSIGIGAGLAKGVTDDLVSVLGAFTGPAPPKTPSNLWVVVGSKP